MIEKYEELISDNYDCYIVGSDQIWRPKYFPNIGNAFLKFTKDINVKRIAYAASFGTDDWEYTNKQTKECSSLLNKFNAISVREKYGLLQIKKYFHCKGTHVLDPTMLLDVEDYIKIIDLEKTSNSKGNLLVYILDGSEEKEKLVRLVANKKLIPFNVNSRVEDVLALLSERIQLPVETWLRGFYDAEFIITDSFHACVFSIIFNKPFLVIGNRDRGLTRIESLLEDFDMLDRLCFLKDDLIYQRIENVINWNIVNKK